MLLFIRKVMMRNDGIESKDDEIQALFNFVATVEEVRNMHINSTQHI
jgi:hypothetical protein